MGTPDVSSSGELAVPLPETGRVILRRPIPIVVQRGATALAVLIAALAVTFSLLYALASGRSYPNGADVLAGLATALIWPVAAILHESGHALTGWAVGHRPVWARIGLVPGVALTPPPVEGWARVLVSGSGPLLELVVGVGCIIVGAELGTPEGGTGPVAMAGGICVINAVANLLPWPRYSDGGKLWRTIWQMLLHR